MSARFPNTTYLMIPVKNKKDVEDEIIRCNSEMEAETIAFALGYRRFRIVEEIEMVDLCRDRALSEKKV